MDADSLDLLFEGEVMHWRGPSPYHFVTVPPEASAAIHDVASFVTYGWGVIPVRVRIGDSVWQTSLFPRDGGYLVPIKDAIRKGERLAVRDAVRVGLSIRL